MTRKYLETRYLKMCAIGVLLTVCGSVAAAAPATPGGGRIYGDAQRGKEYVERLCTTCHAVGSSGTDGAPALALLKKNPQKTEASIRDFLRAPHKPMPAMALTNQEIEDIVAYVLGPIL